MQMTYILTDLFVYTIFLAIAVYTWRVMRNPQQRANWSLVFRRPVAAVSGLIILFFLVIAALDSLHYRPALPAAPGQTATVYGEPRSVLDAALGTLSSARERSYSQPLAYQAFRKETFEQNGVSVRDYPRLRFGGAHLKSPETEHVADLAGRSGAAVVKAIAISAGLVLIGLLLGTMRQGQGVAVAWQTFIKGQAKWPWRSLALTATGLILVCTWVIDLSAAYHVFGTDQTGNSVLVVALKSVRTALVIGSLTTLVVLPLAITLGVIAGYFRGWVDEVIQYIYTLLASIPDVLLIAATVLMLQVFIDTNPALFETALERSDARLFFLCLILGITSFTGLCRLVRGETLKLRELDYIQGAQAFGVSTPRILARHIVPNLMHLVLINMVMQFSAFVLAEAVLSYVGVGVDPNTASFGVMINTARSELAATPIVWWTLATAFAFMVMLVLSTNLLADAIRDAFDPRARLMRRST
jgi:peptide/nickel transport system permease protein